MNIWCVAAPPFGRLDGEMFSPLASIRLRCLEIIPELVKLGNQVTLVPTDQLSDRLANGDHRACDLCIVHKTLVDISQELRIIKDAGARIIVDVTEHPRENRRSARFALAILPFADLVSVSSSRLKTVLESLTSAPIRVIFDCIEGPSGTESAPKPTDSLNLLWFGRSVNLEPLYQFIHRYDPGQQTARPILRVVTDVDGVARDRLDGTIETEPLEWSPRTLRDQLAWSHAVIFPSNGAEIERAKSTNRVQQTLWARRLPVGEFTEGYGGFLKFGLFGAPLETRLTTIVDDWDALGGRVNAGWREVRRNYSAETLAADWRDAAIEVLDQSRQ